jgi:membrane dipeptidase
MLLFDAHLDLAMNALHWNRDLTRTVAETRAAEVGMEQKGRACGTVALPDMRAGEAGLCVATLIARVSFPGNPLPGYQSPAIAAAVAKGQLAYYRILEEQGELRMITDVAGLEASAAEWGVGDPSRSTITSRSTTGQVDPARAPARDRARMPDGRRIGFILSMEGADPILTPDHLGEWWDVGLRAIGPVHYGVARYAHGTDACGGLTELGRPLLKGMEELGMLLDLTHMCDESFWEALDAFGGRVLASHQNSRTLVPGVRQFSDEQMRAVIERGGVIGAALDAWMLQPDWIRGETTNENLTLEAVADQIDYVCQLAGNARHAAVGSDLDGGYGTEQCPRDLDTIVDLQRLSELLRARGYGEADIAAIMHGNWLRFFREAWSA